MELAAVAEPRPVAQAAARREIAACICRLAREVAAEPGLALAQERADVALRVAPSRGGSRPGP